MSYRVESDVPFSSPLFLIEGQQQVRFGSRTLAVCAAAKSHTRPLGAEIRVVQETSGKVVFSKAEGQWTPIGE